MLAKAFAGSDAVGTEDANELRSIQPQEMFKTVQQELGILSLLSLGPAASTAARGRAATSTGASLLNLIRLTLSSGRRTSRERQTGSRDTSTTVDAVELQSSV